MIVSTSERKFLQRDSFSKDRKVSIEAMVEKIKPLVLQALILKHYDWNMRSDNIVFQSLKNYAFPDKTATEQIFIITERIR